MTRPMAETLWRWLGRPFASRMAATPAISPALGGAAIRCREAARKSPKRFVVLAMQRTGSTMVVSALNSHPAIYCHRELFRNDLGATAGLHGLDPRFHEPAFRNAHPQEYLEAIYGMDYAADFVGFKLLLSQHRPIRDRLIEDCRYSKVLLRRDNLLARYASESLLSAARSGTMREDGKIEFVERDFRRYCRRYRRLYDETRRRLMETGQPSLEVSYIEALTPPGLRRIAAAIGADASVELSAKTTKRGSPHIVSRFSNSDQVEDYLTRHHLEHWRSEESAQIPA
ncbi:MAG: hypothetical protein KIS73_01630 [Enhydrobacter sp.]|nr:hypothetical protein [Enhydrobacter sp.]